MHTEGGNLYLEIHFSSLEEVQCDHETLSLSMCSLPPPNSRKETLIP